MFLYVERYRKTILFCAIFIGVFVSVTSCAILNVAKGAKLEAEGEYEKAIKEWNHAIASNPRSSISYYHRAYDYNKLGSYQNSVDDATKAIKLTHKKSIKVKSYTTRANAFMHLGQYKNAIDDCDQAIGLDPKSGTAYFYRSQSYQKIRKDDLAKSDMVKAEEFGYTSEPAEFHK